MNNHFNIAFVQIHEMHKGLTSFATLSVWMLNCFSCSMIRFLVVRSSSSSFRACSSSSSRCLSLNCCCIAIVGSGPWNKTRWKEMSNPNHSPYTARALESTYICFEKHRIDVNCGWCFWFQLCSDWPSWIDRVDLYIQRVQLGLLKHIVPRLSQAKHFLTNLFIDLKIITIELVD